jgi:hypothetical protein
MVVTSFSPDSYMLRAVLSLAGVQTVGRPPSRPRTRAAARPAIVRSRISSCSKSANAPLSTRASRRSCRRSSGGAGFGEEAHVEAIGIEAERRRRWEAAMARAKRDLRVPAAVDTRRSRTDASGTDAIPRRVEPALDRGPRRLGNVDSEFAEHGPARWSYRSGGGQLSVILSRHTLQTPTHPPRGQVARLRAIRRDAQVALEVSPLLSDNARTAAANRSLVALTLIESRRGGVKEATFNEIGPNAGFLHSASHRRSAPGSRPQVFGSDLTSLRHKSDSSVDHSIDGDTVRFCHPKHYAAQVTRFEGLLDGSTRACWIARDV